MLYTRTPRIRFQEFDNNGDPLVGGLVWTYQAGTTTKIPTYQKRGGGTPNTNPIVLDARGEAQVWLSDQYRYKFVVCAAGSSSVTPDHIIKTDDDVIEAYYETQTTVATPMFKDATDGPVLVDLAGLVGSISCTKIDSSVNTVTLYDSTGARTIMGLQTYTLENHRESVSLVLYADGLDWMVGYADTQSRYFVDESATPVDLIGLTGPVFIAKVDATATQIIIQDTSATTTTIMGLATYALENHRETVTLLKNANEWYKI